MRVLSEGRRSKIFENRPKLWWADKRIVCDWCQCIFQLEREDRSKIHTQYVIDESINGGIVGWDEIISCPECFNEVSLRCEITGIESGEGRRY